MKKDILDILKLPKQKNLNPKPLTEILYEMRYGKDYINEKLIQEKLLEQKQQIIKLLKERRLHLGYKNDIIETIKRL
jgi:hypothetical protein